MFLSISRTIFLFIAIISSKIIWAQTDIVSYAGGDGKEVFYDVTQLSDGTFLVCGYCEDLNWISPEVMISQLTFSGNIPNSLGTNRYGFMAHFSSSLTEMLHFVHFPQGAVEDVRFMKTTNLPYETTGYLYISCNTSDTYNNDGGYIIARLNNNFVDAVPTALAWHKNVWAMSYAKETHPWDVTAIGEVYYVSGEAHGYDWSAMYCLDINGNRKVVENWRTHWLNTGSEWKGTPASQNPLGGSENVNYSGIVFKSWGRCELRSWTQEDYDMILADGNGGTKQGLWPGDFLFNGPCDVNNPTHDGPGYNGYSNESCCPVYGASAVVVDKRNGNMYLGMNFKSYSTTADSPDFEPAVVAFDASGTMLWWSRLYHEITPDGEVMQSLPDQYIDALAIDYAHDQLVVAARAHGNNTENLWEGNSIAVNASANGFQNRFTGTNGNIHESWLGKFDLEEGLLHHSTYVAEYAEAADNFGAPHPDPNLDGWPNPNDGWPNVNTTRITKNNMKVSSNGDVIIGGVGRRTITTANAYQKMVKPFYGGLSCWNSFVRQYDSDLSIPKYSSLVVGVWDTLTQVGGGNTDIYGLYKTSEGIVAVGRHAADQATGIAFGNPIPVWNVPSWGASLPSGESAFLVYYKASNIANPNDGQNEVSTSERNEVNLNIYPNPAINKLTVECPSKGDYVIYSGLGKIMLTGRLKSARTELDISHLPRGVYLIKINNNTKRFIKS